MSEAHSTVVKPNRL